MNVCSSVVHAIVLVATSANRERELSKAPSNIVHASHLALGSPGLHKNMKSAAKASATAEVASRKHNTTTAPHAGRTRLHTQEAEGDADEESEVGQPPRASTVSAQCCAQRTEAVSIHERACSSEVSGTVSEQRLHDLLRAPETRVIRLVVKPEAGSKESSTTPKVAWSDRGIKALELVIDESNKTELVGFAKGLEALSKMKETPGKLRPGKKRMKREDA